MKKKVFIFRIQEQTRASIVQNIMGSVKNYEKTGKTDIKKNIIYCQSFETFLKVFTIPRKQIFEIVATKKPNSINEVATLLGKKLPNVLKDIEALESIGLVYFEEIINGRKRVRVPKTNYNCIRVEGSEGVVQFAKETKVAS